MKKSLLFATLVGAALTGCVNDEVATDAGMQKEMLFGTPALKTQTRAVIKGEISGTDAYATGGESFHVTAWSYKGAYNANKWDDDSLDDFFTAGGEDATKTGTYWTTETTHYWPGAAYNLLFAAYSPADFNVDGSSLTLNPEVTYGATGVMIEDFEVQPKADDQYDLMYSDYAQDLNVTHHGGSAVGLTFNHALSSIVFSVSKSQADVHYTITGLELTGTFVTGGTFRQNIGVTDGGGNPVGAQWEYTDSNKKTCEYEPTFDDFIVTETPTQFTSGTSALLLIPQGVPANAKVKLYYTKVSGATTLTGDAEINLSDFVVPVDAAGNTTGSAYTITDWKPGIRYVYRISFGQNKPIYFQPTIGDWVTEPNAVYDISY